MQRADDTRKMGQKKYRESGKKVIDFKAIGSIVFDHENLARSEDFCKARRKKRRIFKQLAKRKGK